MPDGLAVVFGRDLASDWSVSVDLDADLKRALLGFVELASGRGSTGWGPEAIPPPWITDWLDEQGIEDPDARDDYRHWIRLLDTEEREHAAREAKLERELREANKGKGG